MPLRDRLLADKKAELHKEAIRLANLYYLRTGRIPARIKETARATASENIALKFNPNHDPSNGRFTFGSGNDVEDQSNENNDDQDQESTSDRLGSLL